MAGGEAGFHEGAEEAYAWRSGLNSGKLDRQVQPHQPPTQLPACPECGSQRTWKDGVRCTNRGEVQRYICRACGYRFSETTWNNSDEPEHVRRVHTTALYSDRALPSNRQVCVTETQGAKNLAEVEPRIQERAAGATKTASETIKGLVVQYAYWLEKEGYEGKKYLDLIKRLVKMGANLLDPESVKETISKQPWKNGTKMLATYAYEGMAKMLNITWLPPKYTQEENLPFIPDEKELDQLVAGCRSRRMAAFLQTLKETFADPSEALRLRWIDVSNNIISINNPVKHHRPRQLTVSDKLITMLNALPRTSERVFPTTYAAMLGSFLKVRARVSKILQNPRINAITFNTFRHWGATMTFHHTRSLLLVQKILGHKHIANTMKYTQLVNFKDDEFEVAAATTVEEAKELLATGFDYITEKNGIMLFRKPKMFQKLYQY